MSQQGEDDPSPPKQNDIAIQHARQRCVFYILFQAKTYEKKGLSILECNLTLSYCVGIYPAAM